jgi:hypothetical protein
MSKQGAEFHFSLQTQDPSLLLGLFGVELPAQGAEKPLAPSISIRTERVEVQHGLVESTILVNFVLQATSGIATKVIADLLVDHFRDKKAKLTINSKSIEKITPDALVSAMKGAGDAVG